MSILAIILFILFGFVSSDVAVSEPAAAEPVEVSPPWTPVFVDGIQGVIVPAEDASAFGFMEAFTPTEDQVRDAEDAIEAEQGQLDHYRQYVGFTENGQQKISINGFCDALDVDWRTAPVLVDDGGDCYFGAVYNVDTGELESFSFNGDA